MFQLAKNVRLSVHGRHRRRASAYSQNSIEPIVEFLSLAAIDRLSVFNGNIWPKKHVTIHDNRFPNTLYEAIIFAVSLANHAPYKRLPSHNAAELCAQRLLHVIKRGAGERSADVPLRTLLSFYVEKGQIVETGVKRSFTVMNQSSTSLDTESNAPMTDLNTTTNKQQRTVYCIHRNGDSPPELIFVVRKSNTGQPKDWFGENEDLESGLERFRGAVLSDYQNTFSDYRGAVMIAGFGVRTADIFSTSPTAPLNNWVRVRHRYADTFSQTIEHELRNSDFDAKIISVGIDAWGCDTDRIRNFIQRNTIHSFTFMFRTPQLDYGGEELDQRFMQRGQSGSSQTWWGEASSTELLDRLTRVSVIDNSANQIVRGWNLIQGKKDTKSFLACMLAGTSRFRDRGVSSARSPAASLQRLRIKW